jgi:hypothetical protein
MMYMRSVISLITPPLTAMARMVVFSLTGIGAVNRALSVVGAAPSVV